MAPDGSDNLADYRAHMKELLDDCLTRRDDADPKKRFARRGVTQEIFDKKRLIRLFGLVLYEDGHHIDLAAEEHLSCLATKIRGRSRSTGYCNVLATLLSARCTDQSLQDFGKGLIGNTESKFLSDEELPLEEDAACEAFGHDDGNSFWEHQFLFCPVVLIRGDETIYTDSRQSCPLPFCGEPEHIGRGAYAKVYKVRIERGHLITDPATGSALNRDWYAMKQFFDYDAEAKESFEAEESILRKFVQSNKRHDNILVTQASLEYGNTYSLFFDLAKYSLWDYFQDPEVSITAEEKGTVFGRSVGIAGALAFLHDELYLESTGEQLHCYHLDLKPQNILVFEGRDNRDGKSRHIWKISDFGISQMKHIKPNGADVDTDHPVSFLDRIFRPQKQDTNPSSGVDNSRYGGTYGAPEARLTTDKVTRKSDVWSLGCVLIDVLTFLDNGSIGIEEFGEARAKDRDNDRFFEPTPSHFGTELNNMLHSSVTSWLETLEGKAKERHELEGKAFRQVSTLLRESMLLMDQAQRCTAKEAEKRLKRITRQFTRAVAQTPPLTPERSEDSQKPKRKSHVESLGARNRVEISVSSRRSLLAQSWNAWRFPLAAAAVVVGVVYYFSSV